MPNPLSYLPEGQASLHSIASSTLPIAQPVHVVGLPEHELQVAAQASQFFVVESA